MSRISYEIVPGSIFPKPPAMANASYARKAKAQKLAEELFEGELAERLGLAPAALAGSQVVAGGWRGRVLAERQLSGEVLLDLARADFELEWTDWSKDNGERYRTRLRETGRSDLLHWIETHARPEAQRFVEEFDWEGRKGKRKRPP